MTREHLKLRLFSFKGIGADSDPKTIKQMTDMTNKEFGETFTGPILGLKDETVIAENLEQALRAENSTAIAMMDGDRVIGYSYAVPINAMEPERASEVNDTAYIYMTVISPESRHQGRVGRLNEEMLRALLKKGYSFVERDSKIEGDYADKIEKTYGDIPGAIIEKKDHTRWEEVGPERFFRMNIAKALARRYY